VSFVGGPPRASRPRPGKRCPVRLSVPPPPGGGSCTTGQGELASEEGAARSPTWGHWSTSITGTGLNVHWTSIRGTLLGDGQQTARTRRASATVPAKEIGGTAGRNKFGDVHFAVRAGNAGRETGGIKRPVRNVRLTGIPTARRCIRSRTSSALSTNFGVRMLRAPTPGDAGAEKIQLHKPNPSTSGSFRRFVPAFPGRLGHVVLPSRLLDTPAPQNCARGFSGAEGGQ